MAQRASRRAVVAEGQLSLFDLFAPIAENPLDTGGREESYVKPRGGTAPTAPKGREDRHGRGQGADGGVPVAPAKPPPGPVTRDLLALLDICIRVNT